ncbi:MAG: type II toxin-antitoxin system Phd/YefM family antitoxin [Candidatus Promineifilaceae bacterium]
MSTKIMPVSDLRRQTSQVIQSILRDGDVVYVTQHGRPTVVVVDYEQYEALLAQQEVSPEKVQYETITFESVESNETALIGKGVSISVNISSEEARRLVNQKIVPELGTGLGAKEPDLLLRGQQIIWRVPVVLSLPRLGDLGEVGIIEVDAQTGEIRSNEMDQARILQHAQRLYAGVASLSSE